MIRLTPTHYPKPWGSTALKYWFPTPAEPIGEVWLEADKSSPLLIKFLFTSETLSVPVHPNDEQAGKFGSQGKTEMWHVLRADPGAQIAAGFRREISADELRSLAGKKEILDAVEWFDARPGDTFFIPAQTVHAIGGGLVLCEIQQNSDITYRLYDYDRPRPLQIEEALDVASLTPHAARSKREGSILASCEYFRTDEFRISGESGHASAGPAGEFWVVTEGKAAINGQRLSAGEGCFVPPGSGDTKLTGEGVVLRTFAPGP